MQDSRSSHQSVPEKFEQVDRLFLPDCFDRNCAGNGNGSEGGPAYHSGRWAKRVRCLG